MSSKPFLVILLTVVVAAVSGATELSRVQSDSLERPDVLLSIHDRDESARPALEDLTRELLFSTDLAEHVERFRNQSGLQGARLSDLLVAQGSDDSGRAWILVWAPSSKDPSYKTQVNEVEGNRITMLHDGLMWGTPWAVERAASDRGLRNRWMAAVTDPDSAEASEIRARFSPEWALGRQDEPPSWSYRSLMAGVIQFGFEAVAGETVRFRLWVEFDDESSLWFAERELRSTARSRPPNSPMQAEVRVEGRRVELDVSLPDRALANLNHSVTVRRVIRWRTNTINREQWLRVEDIFKAMELTEGSRVADIGAGSGFLSIPMARLVGPAGRVYGVDVNSSPLERLKQAATRFGVGDRIEVIVGEVDDPRLPENQLDAAVIVNAYHEMDQYPAMLRKLKKALKAGGRLVLVEPWSKSRREEGRSDQTSDHIIAPELVESELKEGGFEVLRRDDDFTTSPRTNWLIVARPATAP